MNTNNFEKLNHVVQAVILDEPKLTYHGFWCEKLERESINESEEYSFESLRKKLNDLSFLIEVDKCIQFLEPIYPYCGKSFPILSNDLKHTIESSRMGQTYISKAAVIIAGLIIGFNIRKKQNSPDVAFNIPKNIYLHRIGQTRMEETNADSPRT